MPSAVWSGHLHFGLVVMPVRLLVAARTKTTRFRRLHRKPAKPFLPTASFPSFASEADDESSYMDDRDERGSDGSDCRLASGETTSHEYDPVRQVLQSEATGEEFRPDGLVKRYEFAQNELAAIHPQEINAA